MIINSLIQKSSSANLITFYLVEADGSTVVIYGTYHAEKVLRNLIQRDWPCLRIPASRGMEYEYGKYYLDGEDGKTYLCQRMGEAAGGTIVLQYMPHELIGNYFTEVNA